MVGIPPNWTVGKFPQLDSKAVHTLIMHDSHAIETFIAFSRGLLNYLPQQEVNPLPVSKSRCIPIKA